MPIKKQDSLSPGCQIAFACYPPSYGYGLSIEYYRLMMDIAPTYPETWTPQEGKDWVGAFGVDDFGVFV
jgi:hypothetical protein